MKCKFLLILITISSVCFAKDYSRAAYLLKATKIAFKRIQTQQKFLRTLDFTIEKERARALKILRKQQKLIAAACLDIDRLDNTRDVRVKKSFEQVVLTVCALVTHFFRNVLYKTFNSSFFENGYEVLDFCNEIHVNALVHWVESKNSKYINKSLVKTIKGALSELKQTFLEIPQMYS